MERAVRRRAPQPTAYKASFSVRSASVEQKGNYYVMATRTASLITLFACLITAQPCPQETANEDATPPQQAAQVSLQNPALAEVLDRAARQLRFNYVIDPSAAQPRFRKGENIEFQVTARINEPIQDVRVSMRASRRWSSAWPEGIPVGATIGLPGHWPTSVTTFRIRRSATFSSGTASPPRRNAAKHNLEGFHRCAYGSSCRHGFFPVEALTWRGLVTYYVLFFLHWRAGVTLGGITRHPTEAWITQMARNAADETSGGLRGCRYLLHDHDTKFGAAFGDVLRSAGIHA
jgi:hypothetical protein